MGAEAAVRSRCNCVVVWCNDVLCSVTGEDRWPVSAPLAEGAQPRTGERTLDKRGGSKGKRSWEFPVLGYKADDKIGK